MTRKDHRVVTGHSDLFCEIHQETNRGEKTNTAISLPAVPACMHSICVLQHTVSVCYLGVEVKRLPSLASRLLCLAVTSLCTA